MTAFEAVGRGSIPRRGTFILFSECDGQHATLRWLSFDYRVRNLSRSSLGNRTCGFDSWREHISIMAQLPVQ